MRAMAKVGFFGRLANLWRGFVSLWISDVEKKHPEIAYENAINSMIEKYSQLKHATAAIIRRREDITARLNQQQGELTQVDSDLQTAVNGVDDVTAQSAVSGLPAESARAARIVTARGRTAKTLRYLAARGFGEESIDALVAELEDRALP